MSEKVHGMNALEQFLTLAKSTRGAAAASLVMQVIEWPTIYVFGELLEKPTIRELATGDYAAHFRLLELFAYGTYKQWKANPSLFPPLSDAALRKMKHLSLVSLAGSSKSIEYNFLLEELDLANVRELEDLVIEDVYAGLLRGQLDQRRQRLEIEFASARDVRSEQIPFLIETLEKWCSGCQSLLSRLEGELRESEARRQNQLENSRRLNEEMNAIRRSLRSKGSDPDLTCAENGEYMGEKRKTARGKSLRGSKIGK